MCYIPYVLAKLADYYNCGSGVGQFIYKYVQKLRTKTKGTRRDGDVIETNAEVKVVEGYNQILCNNKGIRNQVESRCFGSETERSNGPQKL